MFYYKAEATFTINGAEVTLNGCKSSERNYSHAVVVVATEMNEFFSPNNTPNPHYGKTISAISFHQGLDNATKAAKSKKYTTYGGKFYANSNIDYGYEINPTVEMQIVETTLVDGKTYRNFQPTYIDNNGQVKVGL
jgi:hypothetical protein